MTFARSQPVRDLIGRRTAVRVGTALAGVIALLAAGLVTGAAAQAATTPTVSGSTGPLSTDFTSSVGVPKFDPALGTLTSITCTLAGTVSGNDGYENTSDQGVAPDIALHLEAQITLQRPDQTQLSIVLPLANTDDKNVPIYDGTLDYGGTSGKTYRNLSATASDTFTLTSASDLALFSGTGNVTLPVVGIGKSSSNANGNVATFFMTKGGALVTCGYGYKPAADLAITKTAPASLVRGSTGQYLINVTNNGPQSTEGTTTVTDTLPDGLTFVPAGSGGVGGFTCSAAGQVVTCTSTTVFTNGQTVSVPIVVAVAQNAPASVSNNAAVGNPSLTDPPGNNGSNTTTTPVNSAADLSLTKSLTSSSLPSAGVGTYAIKVTNNGPSDATGTTNVTDTLPTGLTFLDGAGGGFACTAAGQTVTCSTTSTIANGASTTINLRVNVTAAPDASITNTASVSNPGIPDPVPGNNAGSTTNPVGPAPNSDLGLTKTGPATVTAGQTITYTLTATNSGSFDSPSATVTDTLPSGLTFVSGSGGGFNCTNAGQVVTCVNPSTFAANATSVISLVASTDPGLTGTVANTATISGPYADNNPGNNQATSQTAAITQSSDLKIIKSTTGLTAGTQGTYNLAVTNLGPSTAPAPTKVTDTLPTGLTFIAGGGDGFTCTNAGQAVTCTLTGTEAVSATDNITLTVAVAADATSPIVNSATVFNAADTNPANDTSQISTPLGASDDLTIIKSVVGAVVPGASASYQLKVTNLGPSASAGTTTITDPLPAGLTYVSATGGNFTCAAAAGTVTCTSTESLPVNASRTVTLLTTVGSGVVGSVQNTATVANPNDSNANNNMSTVLTPTTPNDDLAIKKTVDTPLVAGTKGSYTLAVTNNGPSDSAGTTTVKDTLPTGLTFVSATSSVFTCTNADSAVTCATTSSITNGSSATITINVLVAPTALGVIENTATVSNPNDTNPQNNSSTVDTTPTPSDDLTIVKTTSGLTPGANSPYTLAVTNLGPSISAGTTTVTDPLPSGLTFVSGSGDGFSCTNAGQLVTCTSTGSLPVNGVASIALVVAVSADLTETVSNTATVTNPNDGNTSNNTSTAVTSLTQVDDLSIVKSPLGKFTAGSFATYQLAVTNNGPSTSSGTTVVTDTLPAGLTYFAASGGNFTCSHTGQDVTCTSSEALAPTAERDINLVVAVASDVTGDISNTATVTNPNDTNPQNNTSTAVTTVAAADDLSIVKKSTAAQVVGQPTTYTLTITNNGPSDTIGTTTVTDALPAGLLYQNATGGGFTCVAAGQIVTCTSTDPIPNTASRTITLTALVGTAAFPATTNSATVTNPGDDVPGNNTSTPVITHVSGATLGDFVWLDENANGIQDAGEPGVPGVVVTLTGTSATLGPISATTKTDVNGHYEFTGLPAGLYTVSFAAPPGTAFTIAAAGNDRATDSNPAPSGLAPAVTLTPGQTDTSIDAGLVSTLSAVRGIVYHDKNDNGAQSSTEPGVPGATVVLTDTTGHVIATTTTDSTGGYNFGDLGPGQYTVTITPPPGWTLGEGSSETHTVTVPGGPSAVVTAEPTGLILPSSIGDFVWLDRNGNGVQDAGEPGVEGVRVHLSGVNDLGQTVNETVTTDSNGAYNFTELRPGKYTVTFSHLPSGAAFTKPTQGSDTAKDSNADPATGATAPIVLAENTNNLTIDAGLVEPSQPGGTGTGTGGQGTGNQGTGSTGGGGVPGSGVAYTGAGNVPGELEWALLLLLIGVGLVLTGGRPVPGGSGPSGGTGGTPLGGGRPVRPFGGAGRLLTTRTMTVMGIGSSLAALVGCSGSTQAAAPKSGATALERHQPASTTHPSPSALVQHAPDLRNLKRNPVKRAQVAIGTCGRAAHGWRATGTAVNPSTKSPTGFRITVLFTTPGGTVQDYAATAVRAQPGDVARWTASRSFAAIANTRCVIAAVS